MKAKGKTKTRRAASLEPRLLFSGILAQLPPVGTRRDYFRPMHRLRYRRETEWLKRLYERLSDRVV